MLAPDTVWNTEQLLQESDALLSSTVDSGPPWLAICRLIQDSIPGCDWVGFYWKHPEKDRMLLLGDYVGEPTEHTEIPYGRGICGQVAESLKTYVSDDVTLESNYIACSLTVRSEIVVPILKDGGFYGQLDIDSHTQAAFTPKHRKFCEDLCRLIESRI